MKLSRFILALLLVQPTISAAVAAAQMGSGSMEMQENETRHPEDGPSGKMFRPHGDPFSPESLREMLGLTDDQVQKISQLRLDYEKETIRKHADIRVAELELKNLLEQKNIDMGAFEKKVRQLEGLRGDLMLLRVKDMQKAKEFLNEKQFAHFKEMIMRMATHRMGRMDGMMMMPKGHPGGPMEKERDHQGGEGYEMPE